jgi:hypothetical protein
MQQGTGGVERARMRKLRRQHEPFRAKASSEPALRVLETTPRLKAFIDARVRREA